LRGAASRVGVALIIDREVTIMGSYNFSAAAARNSEDLNVATSPEVAATYGEGVRDIADNHLAFSIVDLPTEQIQDGPL
jgi:phosphatidylserine/phosphatidylglycerophosphate/cardiolipin synthase-like enzyme